MKKLFFLTTALALVIGLSQCTKTRPDMPHYSGQVGDMYVQHVTVGASHGSSNSKVSGSQSGTALDLVWDKGDELNVYDQTKEASLPNTLKLKGNSGSNEGQFEGDITATTDDELTFYYKGSKAVVEFNEGAVTYAASNFIGQDGTLDGDDGVFKRLLIMKKDVKFPLDGSTLELSVPYAIVFLDLSSFGSTDKASDDVVEIYKGEEAEPVATVKGVTTASNGMYVVMPTDDTEQTYTLEGSNGKTVKYTWTLDGNTFYTAAGTGGGPVTDCFCFTAIDAGSTVRMFKVGSVSVSLEYSTDGTTWNDFDFAKTATITITLTNTGDKVYFRAKSVNTKFSIGNIDYFQFITKGNLAVSGNIMYLLNGTTPATTLDATNHKYCFNKLFNNCKAITDASGLLLPATTLANSCYEQMFNGCIGLTTAPELPATELANSCYYSMFQGCTGLVTAPELPATELANSCYKSMFNGCTGLVTAPVFSATTLANSCCEQMFYGCTGLVTVPALPATTLANSCYGQMFYGCTGLETAPALPATTLANSCYEQMFYGCTGLTTAPALPATEMADGCYLGMFRDCTGLTTAPALPATELGSYCYGTMFSGCTNLSSVTMLATYVDADNCLTYWLRDAGTGIKTVYINKDASDETKGTIETNSPGWTVVRQSK